MKKIRLNSYLEKAKELDIKPFEISYSVSKSISVSVFNGEIEQQEIGNETALSARGIYDGKVGLYSIDSINKDSVDELVNGVFSSSKYGKEESEDSFFDGKGKYKKVKIDQKEFPCASRTDDNFSAKPDSSKYGSTYHALSFDVDDCFVFLPYTKAIEFHRKSFLFTPCLKTTEKNILKYQNELNILFTRGRKSLIICVEDITAYLLLRKRWLRLKKGKQIISSASSKQPNKHCHK